MLRPQTNFAFIDSQNLHLSIRRLGWSLDFERFRAWVLAFVSDLESSLKRKEPRKDGTLKGAFRGDLERE